jgi:hypothetical protein
MSRSFPNHTLAFLACLVLLGSAGRSRAVAATNAPPAPDLPTAIEPEPCAKPARSWGGPMRTHTVGPFHMLRPSPTTLTPPAARDTRATRLDVDMTWGNLWTYAPGLYRFDGEWVWARLSAQRQIGRASLRLTATAVDRSGGALDSTIEAFHRRIGRDDGSRADFPHNQATISIGAGDDAFLREGRARRLGDTSLSFAWTCLEPTGLRPAISTELLVTLPSGDADELTGLGNPLYGVGLLAEQPLGDSGATAYAGLLASYSTADSLAGLDLYKLAMGTTLGVEYAWNRRWSGLVQYLSDSAVAKHIGELSASMHELTVGIRRRGAGRTTVEAGIVENLARFGNSADIALHAGLRRTF